MCFGGLERGHVSNAEALYGEYRPQLPTTRQISQARQPSYPVSSRCTCSYPPRSANQILFFPYSEAHWSRPSLLRILEVAIFGEDQL